MENNQKKFGNPIFKKGSDTYPKRKVAKLKMAKQMGIPKCALRLVDIKKDPDRGERAIRRKVELRKDIRALKEKLKDLGLKERQLTKPGRLTLFPRQHRLLELLVDFENNYTTAQICEKLDITPQKYRRWRNDPIFQKALDREITKRSNQVRKEAYSHIFKRVRRGDIRTIFKYLQMTGDMKENLSIGDSDNIQDSNEDDLQAEIDRLTNELGLTKKLGSN